MGLMEKAFETLATCYHWVCPKCVSVQRFGCNEDTPESDAPECCGTKMRKVLKMHKVTRHK